MHKYSNLSLYLCVTHTERSLDYERCSLNYLTNKYCNRRLNNVPKFEDLPHSNEAYTYNGDVTIWKYNSNKNNFEISMHIQTNFKSQHAHLCKEGLWVFGSNKLHLYDLKYLKIIKKITDPWMAGGHTCFINSKNKIVLSCSGSDSVLIVDPIKEKTESYFRMPEKIYGKNYDISRNDSVFEHYIPNEFQTTHINCAYPFNNKILISTLIQGSIGVLSEDMTYKEVLKGFVGCHGIRKNPYDNTYYFCDSCTGVLVILGPDFQIEKRYDCNCKWLHDAQIIDKNHYALAVADRNTVEILNINTLEVVNTLECDNYGNGVQFLSTYFG